jgi:hypothetical protein
MNMKTIFKYFLFSFLFLFSISAYSDCGGMSAFKVIRLVYSSTNVTTSAWVSLTNNLSMSARCISVFDSSGQTMVLGLGQSGSQVAQNWYIFPGGITSVPFVSAIGANLWIEAVSGTASSGEIDINLYQ